MPARDIVVIGASAGGIDPLRRIAAGLPPDLPAALFVVLHTAPWFPSALPEILTRSGRLVAGHAKDGESIRHGRIYVAPPDHHLVLSKGKVRLSLGPRENWHRPAIDVLFRSAAESFGPRVIGVMLSGVLHDGILGLMRVKSHGGVVIVQDPDETLYPTMALTAMQHVDVDHVVTAAQIPPLIEKFATMVTAMPVPNEPTESSPQTPDLKGKEAAEAIAEASGQATGFMCPECGGSLWEAFEGGLVHYHCHVGHVFTPENLLMGQGGTIERNLWGAVRTLQEQAALLLRSAERARRSGDESTGRRLTLRARRVEEKANRVGAVLEQVMKAEPYDVESLDPAASE